MYIDSGFNNWKFKNCLILVISKYNVKKIKLICVIYFFYKIFFNIKWVKWGNVIILIVFIVNDCCIVFKLLILSRCKFDRCNMFFMFIYDLF